MDMNEMKSIQILTDRLNHVLRIETKKYLGYEYYILVSEFYIRNVQWKYTSNSIFETP